MIVFREIIFKENSNQNKKLKHNNQERGESGSSILHFMSTIKPWTTLDVSHYWGNERQYEPVCWAVVLLCSPMLFCEKRGSFQTGAGGRVILFSEESF